MCLNVKVKAYTLPLSILFSLQVILFLNVDVFWGILWLMGFWKTVCNYQG